ncbi:hypothetical protein RUND412_006249 [Rhizina undulata]
MEKSTGPDPALPSFASEPPHPGSRRRGFRPSKLLMVVVPLLVFIAWPWSKHFPCPLQRHSLSIEQRVEKILAKTPLIDGHNDLPIAIRMAYQNRIYEDNFTFESGFEQGHTDIPRLQKGLVGGIFWSVYMPCPVDDTDFSDAAYYQLIHDTFQQIDVVHRLVSRYSSHLSFAASASAAVEAHSAGKVASIIGVEGLHQIGNSPAVLRHYFDLGVRYITLTHVCNNKYADGALAPSGAKWGGLSKDGEKLVREMNRLGMIVDLSHVTAETMRSVLKEGVVRAPVMFSHSSAYSICPHPRNVPDDVLHSVKENGGVVMVNFYNYFVHCGEGKDPKDATLAHVADHIEHIARLIGWEHVGIGSDYDGIEVTPKGLEDVSKFPDLFAELLRRGATDRQLAALAGGNVLRVWDEVERVAERMQAEGVEILEDEVPKVTW